MSFRAQATTTFSSSLPVSLLIFCTLSLFFTRWLIHALISDHGAPGILAFPTHGPFGAALHANKLQDTITKMHADNKYSKMVLYVEACESGSMFNKVLASNLSVYAVTAATPFESSYACYQDKYAHQYIGDCFSNHVRAAARCSQMLAFDLTHIASGWKIRMLLIGP